MARRRRGRRLRKAAAAAAAARRGGQRKRCGGAHRARRGRGAPQQALGGARSEAPRARGAEKGEAQRRTRGAPVDPLPRLAVGCEPRGARRGAHRGAHAPAAPRRLCHVSHARSRRRGERHARTCRAVAPAVRALSTARASRSRRASASSCSLLSACDPALRPRRSTLRLEPATPSNPKLFISSFSPLSSPRGCQRRARPRAAGCRSCFGGRPRCFRTDGRGGLFLARS